MLSEVNMDVLTNIIGAVESGGQVYGKRNYKVYGEPYQTTPNEHTITLGWACNYGSNARKLMKRIFEYDPEGFRKLDTAGIEKMLPKDWVSLRWKPTPAQRSAIISIIDSPAGHRAQDDLFKDDMKAFIKDCEADYTEDPKSVMMYCEIRHLGGKSGVNRIFKRISSYDLDSIMASLVKDQKDTSSSNQVGDKIFWSRHLKCRQWADEYAEVNMPVKIGSARIDERGQGYGGKAGDQTGVEVSTQNWYLHSKGWVLLRAKDPAKREKIARAMEMACANPHIGYDQGQNMTLYYAVKDRGYDPSKVTADVETDCAKLVRVCVLYAGIDCGDFYTANEVDTLRRTGQFDIYTDDAHTKSSKLLLRGDIEVTKTMGHTVVVLSDGSGAPGTDTKDVIRRGQESSIEFTGAKIDCDGIRGPETRRQAARVLQTGINLDYKADLEVDGEFGPKSRKALGKHYVKRGETQFMVTAAEILLMMLGKDPHGVEYPGTFGRGLEAAAGRSRIDAETFLSYLD